METAGLRVEGEVGTSLSCFMAAVIAVTVEEIASNLPVAL